MTPEEGEDGVFMIYREEGTRIARVECEDGSMNTYICNFTND